jgi:hypothetical protein
LGDDLDEAGAPAGQMLGHPVVQVLGPVLEWVRVRLSIRALCFRVVPAEPACTAGS